MLTKKVLILALAAAFFLSPALINAYAETSQTSPLYAFLYIKSEEDQYISSGYSSGELEENETVTIDLYVYFWEKPVDPDTMNISAVHESSFLFDSNYYYGINMTRIDTGHYRGKFIADPIKFKSGWFMTNHISVNISYAGNSFYTRWDFTVKTSDVHDYDVEITSIYDGIDYSSPGDTIPINVKFYKDGELFDPDMKNVTTRLSVNLRGFNRYYSWNVGQNYSLNRLSKGSYDAKITIPANLSYYGEFDFEVTYQTGSFYSPSGDYWITVSPFTVWSYENFRTESKSSFDIYVADQDGKAIEGAKVIVKSYDFMNRTRNSTTDKYGVAHFVVSGNYDLTDSLDIDVNVTYNGVSFIDSFSFNPIEYQGWTPDEHGLSIFPVSPVKTYWGETPVFKVGVPQTITLGVYNNGVPLSNNPVVIYMFNSSRVLFSFNVTTNSTGEFNLSFTIPSVGLYYIKFRTPVDVMRSPKVWREEEGDFIGVEKVVNYTYADLITNDVVIDSSLYFGMPLQVSWYYDKELTNGEYSVFLDWILGEVNLTRVEIWSENYQSNWTSIYPGEFHLYKTTGSSKYTVNITLPDYLPKNKPITIIAGYVVSPQDSNSASELDMILNLQKYIKLNTATVYWQEPVGTVTGRVKDKTTAKPLSNVTVSAGNLTVKTNENGEYNMTLRYGSYNVSFERDGYKPIQDIVRVNLGETTYLNITMEKLPPAWSNLRVYVKNTTGSPIKNATISLSYNNLTDRTDKNGIVEFDYLPRSFLTVEVGAKGYIPQEIGIELVKNSTTYLNVTLKSAPNYPFGNIEGIVKDSSSSEYLSGVHIIMRNGNITYERDSLLDGSFYVGGIPVGNYTISASLGDYKPYSEEVEVLQNSTTHIKILLIKYKPPTFYDGGVEKKDGKYQFKVTYEDEEGRSPDLIVVVVDGKEYNMTKTSGNYSSGAIYTLSLELSEGKHNYYFRVLGPEGEELTPEDDTPYQNTAQSVLNVEKGKTPTSKNIYLIAGVVALLIILAIVALMLKKPKTETGKEE